MPTTQGPAPASLADRMVDMVVSRRNHSENRHQWFLNRINRWYGLYRGLWMGKTNPFSNDIRIPFLFSVIQSDVARKVQTSLGSWPICQFTGYGPSDEAIARKNEVLVSAQMKDANSFVKAVDFFLSADLYGTAIARHGWAKKTRKERRRFTILDQEGVVEGKVTWFDGPDWELIDRLDFYPQPGFKRIPEMAWVIHRYLLDYDDVRALADQGMFVPSQVSQLKNATPSAETTRQIQERLSVYRTYDDYAARSSEKFAKPVELLEYWGVVPSEFAPDGITNRVITIANRRLLLRNDPSPFWHGDKPFVAYSPMPDPHYFDGTGKMEIGEKMQATANKLANHQLDILDLFASPTFMVNRQAGIDTSNLVLRPGRVIGIDGPVDDTQIRPLIPDLRGLQQIYPQIGSLWNWIQQGTGIAEDVIMGMPSSDRQTAREYMGRQENVLTRVMLEARLAEEGFLEPLANYFRALNKQFLSVPKEIRMMGNAAVINPITGLPLPQDPVTINLEDVYPDYRARAVGATQTLGRMVRQQNLMLLMQAMSSNPVMLQMVNWANFARQLFETFDMKNVDELLVNSVPAINQMAQQMGGSPEQAAGVVSQTLPSQAGDLWQQFGGGNAPIPMEAQGG